MYHDHDFSLTVIATGGYFIYGVFKNRIAVPVTSTGAVPLFHTQPSSDTVMRQLGRIKPASVVLCVA